MADSKTESRKSSREMTEAKASAERALEEARAAAGHGAAAGRAKLDETTEQLRDGVQRGYERAGTAVEKGYTKGRKAIGSAAESCESYVREHPAMALSAAAGLGLMTGLLVRGRSNGSQTAPR